MSGSLFATVEKVQALFRAGDIAMLCASVVREKRTIRRSLREKYFLPHRSVSKICLRHIFSVGRSGCAARMALKAAAENGFT